MFEIGNRHAVRICDQDVEFRVRNVPYFKHPFLGEGNWIVDIVLPRAPGEIRGADLKIRLLDQSFAPLAARALNPMDLFALPQFRLHGSDWSYKFALFNASKNVGARHLVLDFLGHEGVFPLKPAGRGKKREKPPRREDDDSRRDEGETFEIADKKCCPDKFTTPEGDLPTRRRVSQKNLIIQSKPWVIDATFKSDPPPCDCDCCEYRQELKGSMKIVVVVDGKETEIGDALPTSDYSPPEAAGQEPKPKKRDPSKFEDDTIGLKEFPGKPAAYGHRKDKGKPQFDTIDQDYPTACSYWAADEPNWSIAEDMTGTPGIFLVVDYTFKGKIIDGCNQVATLIEKAWTWKTRQPI